MTTLSGSLATETVTISSGFQTGDELFIPAGDLSDGGTKYETSQ